VRDADAGSIGHVADAASVGGFPAEPGTNIRRFSAFLRTFQNCEERLVAKPEHTGTEEVTKNKRQNNLGQKNDGVRLRAPNVIIFLPQIVLP